MEALSLYSEIQYLVEFFLQLSLVLSSEVYVFLMSILSLDKVQIHKNKWYYYGVRTYLKCVVNYLLIEATTYFPHTLK